MRNVSLHAHFDGRQIVLDEPYDLPTNASLIVTVLPESVPAAKEGDSEREWLASAMASNAFAFLADEAEDIYTVADGEPFHNAM
jgi:hypothetical protein